MKHFLSLLFVLISLTQTIMARDIFIATGGNDNKPGTQNQPLASLTGARNLMRQLKANGTKDDFRIIVAPGTYLMYEPLVLDPEDSGTETNPLTISSATGEKPIFMGGIPLKNWEKVSEKLWKIHVPEVKQYGLYFEQLYVNGKFVNRAKSPNKGFYVLKKADETIIDKGTGRVPTMAVQKLSIPVKASEAIRKMTEPDLNDALLTFYHKWDNTRKRIAGFNPDSLIVYTSGEGMKSWNKLDKQTRFTIDNYQAALDTCGEWYLNREGDLYYMPYPGETIENTKIYAPVANQFIVLKGDEATRKKVQHIRIENLTFAVSAYHTPLWGNEAAQAAAPIDAVIMADYAHNIELLNCEISQTGTNAIWFRKACSNSKISQCYVHDLGAGGIKLGDISIPKEEQDLTHHIVVDNNIIRTGGFVFPCAVGLTIFQASDNRITHNEIANFRYSGVSVGWVWGYTPSPSKRNIIEFNHIHHLGWGELCDMGGVYCLGASEGSSVSNNVIHHVYSFDYGGWGLYTDEGSTGITMENNLVYACKNSGFHQHYGKENIIRNNIFAGNIKAQLQATRVEEHLSFSFTNNIVWFNSGTLLTSNWSKINLKTDNNCYWDTRTKDIPFGKLSFIQWQTAGKDQHSIIADPEFENPQTFDFRIKNKALLKKIGFKPFDYSQAGVYGTNEWVALGKFDPEIATQYDEAILKLEKK